MSNSQNDYMKKVQDIQTMMLQGQKKAEARIGKNKHHLFDFFDSKGIKAVEVRFDGSGDSGGVEEISLIRSEEEDWKGADEKFLLSPIEGLQILESTSFGPDGIQENFSSGTVTLQDAIESVVYDALKATHEGWENNDGAYGTVMLDSEHRSVSMEYYERSTEFHEHEF